MSKASNGIKAGAIAGVVYGIISAVFALISLTMYKNQIINALQSYVNANSVLSSHGFTAQSLYRVELIAGPAVEVVLGIIVGLILGLIFSYISHRLPGSSNVVKGVILGIFLWLILGVLMELANLKEYGSLYYELAVIGSLIAAVAYGVVLGKLYTRFEESGKEAVSS